jgi:hypothetical protein
LFVSVFVPVAGPIDAHAIATRVRPFKRAAIIAKAAMPLTMHGIMVTPFQQAVIPKTHRRGKGAASKKSGATIGLGGFTQNATGVVITAFFNVRTSVLLDSTVSDTSPGNCESACAIWGAASATAAAALAAEAAPADPESDMALFGLF